MFSLTVCDHIMIAHSFKGEAFGPAQRLHGATYVVEVEFQAGSLGELDILIDVGLAKQELRRLLDGLDYTNLDENPALAGRNTSIEFMACHIHSLLVDACREGRLGHAGQTLAGIKVILRESPTAWASFEGPVD
jgi:6-pyruvoyl-tetrahydropterin synthase